MIQVVTALIAVLQHLQTNYYLIAFNYFIVFFAFLFNKNIYYYYNEVFAIWWAESITANVANDNSFTLLYFICNYGNEIN